MDKEMNVRRDKPKINWGQMIALMTFLEYLASWPEVVSDPAAEEMRKRFRYDLLGPGGLDRYQEALEAAADYFEKGPSFSDMLRRVVGEVKRADRVIQNGIHSILNVWGKAPILPGDPEGLEGRPPEISKQGEEALRYDPFAITAEEQKLNETLRRRFQDKPAVSEFPPKPCPRYMVRVDDGFDVG